MDVHPPHHPLHTWKDFWIHLITITIGLLIALSLEASVEALHHRHQRHQLEEDLREEASKNVTMMQRDYVSIDNNLAWLDAFRNVVDAMRTNGGKNALAAPPAPPLKNLDGTTVISFTMPSAASWNSARESAMIALLPPEEARVYTRVYYEYQLLQETFAVRSAAIRARLEFESRFHPLTSSPTNPDLALMSPAQLDQESALLTSQWYEVNQLRHRVDFFYSAEKAVLDGVSSEEDVAARTVEYPSTLQPSQLPTPPAH